MANERLIRVLGGLETHTVLYEIWFGIKPQIVHPYLPAHLSIVRFNPAPPWNVTDKNLDYAKRVRTHEFLPDAVGNNKRDELLQHMLAHQVCGFSGEASTQFRIIESFRF